MLKFSEKRVLVKENEESFDLRGQLIGLSDPAHHPKNPVYRSSETPPNLRTGPRWSCGFFPMPPDPNNQFFSFPTPPTIFFLTFLFSSFLYFLFFHFLVLLFYFIFCVCYVSFYMFSLFVCFFVCSWCICVKEEKLYHNKTLLGCIVFF